MKEELIKKLNERVEAGTKKSQLEELIGLPANSLSAVLAGHKEMPDNWVEKVKTYLYQENAPCETIPEKTQSKVTLAHNPLSSNTGIWGDFLTTFKGFIAGSPPPEEIQAQLGALKTMAADSNELTLHQKDGIIARCDNYLKGEYGKTKTQENLDYQHKGAK
jgi:hypothetical protein